VSLNGLKIPKVELDDETKLSTSALKNKALILI
jgi:hypothetical protein